MEEIAGAWLNIIKSSVKLFLLEARLAKRSILPFIINVLILLIVGFSFWLILLFGLGYLVYYYVHSLGIAIGVDLFVTAVLIIIVTLMLLKYSRRIQFRMTKKQIRHYKAR